jgi:hypothetical protein
MYMIRCWDEMHIETQDTFTLGISWQSKELYGEGGFQLHIGFKVICFWKTEDY